MSKTLTRSQRVQAAAVLREAADIIERDGWCREHLFGPGGTCCAVGAISRATGGGDPVAYGGEGHDVKLDDLARTLLARHLSERTYGTPGNGFSIPHWNDNMAKGGKHVVTEMRAAATEAERGRRFKRELPNG